MPLSDILDNLEKPKASKAQFPEKIDGVSLRNLLQQATSKYLREKTPWKTNANFRPSGITYSYCRRLKVAQLAELVDIYDPPKRPKEILTMDMGSAIHDIVQDKFWKVGKLKGSFECLKCDKIYHDLTSPTKCPSGIASHHRGCLKYKEVVYKNQEYRISGRSDGIIITPDNHLMDIKSIQNRLPHYQEMQFCFEDLDEKGPKADHVVQLMLYEWMSDIHKGHLLYVAKNTHQVKSFAVQFDYKVIEPYLKEIKWLISLGEQIKAGQKPELPIPCGREDCPCHIAI